MKLIKLLLSCKLLDEQMNLIASGQIEAVSAPKTAKLSFNMEDHS